MEYQRFRLYDDESVRLLNQISNRGQLKSLLFAVFIKCYKIFKNFNWTLLVFDKGQIVSNQNKTNYHPFQFIKLPIFETILLKLQIIFLNRLLFYLIKYLILTNFRGFSFSTIREHLHLLSDFLILSLARYNYSLLLTILGLAFLL